MAVPPFLFSSLQRATTQITLSNLLLWPQSLFSYSLLCQTQLTWLQLHILLSGPISGCKGEFLLLKDYSTCLHLQVLKWTWRQLFPSMAHHCRQLPHVFCLMYLKVVQTSIKLPDSKNKGFEEWFRRISVLTIIFICTIVKEVLYWLRRYANVCVDWHVHIISQCQIIFLI